MAILGPDGLPRQNGVQPVNQPTTMGFIILRQEPGKLVPMFDDKGAMAVFASQQAATQTASALADQELRPRADQKVVTPAQKSSMYLVAAVQIIGQIQAKLRDPAQILAPQGKTNA